MSSWEGLQDPGSHPKVPYDTVGQQVEGVFGGPICERAGAEVQEEEPF